MAKPEIPHHEQCLQTCEKERFDGICWRLDFLKLLKLLLEVLDRNGDATIKHSHSIKLVKKCTAYLW